MNRREVLLVTVWELVCELKRLPVDALVCLSSDSSLIGEVTAVNNRKLRLFVNRKGKYQSMADPMSSVVNDRPTNAVVLSTEVLDEETE